MIVFNAWYYSFSPPVANYIANHWIQRAAMQVLLYPMVGMLGVSSEAFKLTSAYPETAIVLAGVLASAMLGAFYLGLPVGVLRARVKRFNARSLGRALEQVLAGTTITSGSILVLGEMTGSSTILMISSAALVLAMMLLSSTFVSNRIAQLARGAQAN
jgi:hypothetical protein